MATYQVSVCQQSSITAMVGKMYAFEKNASGDPIIGAHIYDFPQLMTDEPSAQTGYNITSGHAIPDGSNPSYYNLWDGPNKFRMSNAGTLTL